MTAASFALYQDAMLAGFSRLTSLMARSVLVGSLLPLLALSGCGEEPPKTPAVSANLCVYLPNGMTLGPYDTQKECGTARENMPGGECRPCQK